MLRFLLLFGATCSLLAQNSMDGVGSTINTAAPIQVLDTVHSDIRNSHDLYDADLFAGILAGGSFSERIAAPFNQLPENYLTSLAQIITHLPIDTKGGSQLVPVPPKKEESLDEAPLPATLPNRHLARFETIIDLQALVPDDVFSTFSEPPQQRLLESVSATETGLLFNELATKEVLTESLKPKVEILSSLHALADNSLEQLEARAPEQFRVLRVLLWLGLGLLPLLFTIALVRHLLRRSRAGQRRRHWKKPASKQSRPALQAKSEKTRAPAPPLVSKSTAAEPAPVIVQLDTQRLDAVIKAPQSAAPSAPLVTAASKMSLQRSQRSHSRSNLSRFTRRLLRFFGLRNSSRKSRRRRHRRA